MKLLLISPHLSTGGLPQYLLWHIQQIISSVDLYLVEYNCSSLSYVVQRNKILNLIQPNHFFSLTNKQDLLDIVKKVKPDIIHWAEIPEQFCESSISDVIYDSKREYLIVETTHGSLFDLNNKKYFPDKFILVCEWSKQQYNRFNVPIDVIEYPITFRKRTPPVNNRKQVINVGLFTPGKNQGEAFEIARKIPEADFHFLGNQADNFRSYWEPLMKDKPSNCFIHGEIENVDEWYAKSDLFLFTSKLELNPLSVKEAIGWGLPVLMRDLPTYCGRYKGPFLTDDLNHNVQLVRGFLYDK